MAELCMKFHSPRNLSVFETELNALLMPTMTTTMPLESDPYVA